MNISGISGIFGIGKARRERAAAYVREAIAEEAATRALIDTRLGEAIDKLEAIVTGVANTCEKNTTELTARLNRMQTAMHVLRDRCDSLAREIEHDMECALMRGTDGCTCSLSSRDRAAEGTHADEAASEDRPAGML